MHSSTPTNRDDLIRKLANELFASHGGQWDIEDFSWNLQRYSDDLLNLLFSSNQSDRSRFHHVRESILHGLPEGAIRERVVFLPEYQSHRYAVADNIINSLHHYPQLPSTDDFTSAGPDVMKKCSALLAVMDAYRMRNMMSAFRKQDPAYIIADSRIVDLVVSDPGKAFEVTNFIHERRTSDADALLDYFNSSTPALRSGIV